MLKLDHLVVAGETLDAATAHIEEALGIAMLPGGRHARYGTHNRLLGLEDGLYLEAIAIDPAAPPPSMPRWFGLDQFSGCARLISWACRVSDLPVTLAGLPADHGHVIPMQRGDLRWLMAVSDSGALPGNGAAPMLLQWQGALPPGDLLPASGCRLKRLTISAPFPDTVPRPADDRIRSKPGPTALLAEFQTPHGHRVLE